MQRFAPILRRRSVVIETGATVMSKALSTTTKEAETASFGFRDVDPEEKSTLVGNVFSSVAHRYDLMNDIMSAGVHRLWKSYYVSQIPISSKMRHIDVAGGTGDIALRLLNRIDSESEIVVCDISPAMIENGKKRVRKNDERLQWVVGDAEKLPFGDNSFDTYSIAFGIRNTTHMDIVLTEAHRVLKPGGFFSCLEFSQVRNPFLRSAYDLYSFNVIPFFGQFVVGDRESYQYLAESIRRFPEQEPFAERIREAGFVDVVYENLTGGMVAIHSGLKGRE